MSEETVEQLVDEYVRLGQVDSDAAEEGTSAAAEAAADETSSSAAMSESVTEEESDDKETDTKESESEDESSDETEGDNGETDTDDADQEDFAPLDEIPTAEELQKFPRTNPEAKAKMVELADGWRETKVKLESVGGEKGVEVLQPLAQILTKAEASNEELDTALSSILNENQEVGTQLLAAGAYLMLNYADDPKIKSYGDRIAQFTFGATPEALREIGSVVKEFDTNAEHIKDLLKLEAAGMITDADHDAFRANYGGSELYDKQLAEIERLKAENATIKANPQALLEPIVDSSQAVRDFEQTLLERIETGVAPIRETGRWTADMVLAKTVNDAIMASLRDEPEYKEALKVLRRDGDFRKDNLAMTTALATLSGKAKGRFQQAVRGINADLRKISETSLNAKRKVDTEKVEKDKKEVETKTTSTPVVADPLTNPFGRPRENVEDLWKQYTALESDKALAAARSV